MGIFINPNAIQDNSMAKDKLNTSLQAEIDNKQEALTLTVKDNGNIVIANIQGQSKEFMPATPSGDPMHYAYVAAGAEYNDTGADIVKTAPWADLADNDADKTVVHKAGYWYLNGLGDITNAEMSTIFSLYGVYNAINSIGCLSGSKVRTLFNPYSEDLLRRTLAVDSFGSFSELLSVPYRLVLGSASNYAFTNARNLIYIHTISLISISKLSNSFDHCYNLKFIRINGVSTKLSFSHSSGLSIKSVLYMINNEAATSPITITLHADVYNKCMANADILAALETHTNISLASA